MQYPKRAAEHILETASAKALESCLPDAWIVRHATERDYGLDCIVEIVGPDHAVKGDMAAIQLKGASDVRWRCDAQPVSATISGIQTTTIAYWLGLPVPVLLCVFDQSDCGVYWTNPREQVRERFDQFRSQSTFGLNLDRSDDLRDTAGLDSFVRAYRRELMYPRFVAALLSLVANTDSHVEYMGDSLGRDFHMTVEGRELAQLLHLYDCCKTVSDYLGKPWELPSITELFERDARTSGEPGTLHESSRDLVVRKLISAYIEAVDAGLQLIDEQAPYWYSVYPYLMESLDLWSRERFVDGLRARFELRRTPEGRLT
jgi:hypothetical protein